jgi:hypothetical protein
MWSAFAPIQAGATQDAVGALAAMGRPIFDIDTDPTK